MQIWGFYAIHLFKLFKINIKYRKNNKRYLTISFHSRTHMMNKKLQIKKSCTTEYWNCNLRSIC